MSGAGSMSAMNASLSNNRALLKKRRLKNNPYLSTDRVSRQGKADYQELKAWRLQRESLRKRSRITVFIVSLLGVGAVLYFILNYLP